MSQTGKELTTAQSKAVSLKNYLHRENVKEQFAAAIPEWLSVDRMLRVVFTSVMKSPKLLECTQESILSAVMQCCQLGLEPILGRAHLIPYQNSKLINGTWQKVYECQFQPGYQGLIDLGQRSGKIANVYALVVYEKDFFEHEEGFNRKLIHRPYPGEDAGKPIGAYAVWELSNGVRTFDFMYLHEIYKRRDVSQAYQYAASQLAKNKNDKKALETPWIKWEADMMKKTVIINSSKTKPASIEFMQAVELDGTAEMGRSQLGMFIDTSKLPELEMDTTEPEPEPDAAPEPPDTSEFYGLVEKQIGKKFEYKEKDGKPADKLSEFISVSATAQRPSIDSATMMSMVTEETFPGFWNAYERYLKAQATTETGKGEQQPAATETKTKEKAPALPAAPPAESSNPFDQTNWKSTKLGGESVSTFFFKNKIHFDSASDESKAEFRDLWYRRFSDKKEDGSHEHPFPMDPKDDPATSDDRAAEDKKPEQLGIGNQKPSDPVDHTEELQLLLENEQELYLRACEECGYNSMIVPEILEEQAVLWNAIEELKASDEFLGKF